MNLRTVYSSWEEGIRAIVMQLLAFDTANTSALDLKANILSPTLTGTPAAPTAAVGTNTTQIATTAFVTSAATKSGKLFFFSSF